MDTISELRGKTRALVEDFSKKGNEAFIYNTGDQVFPLAEDYPSNITSVSKNGTALGSGEYSFDSDTNEVTVTASLSSGDAITVKYTYYKYSNTEIDEYIRGALVWISSRSICETDYKIETGDIYPTPDNKTEDLIAIIASILIKPNYTEYRLPNITIRTPETMSKEEKILKFIDRFQMGLGVNEVLELE